MGDSLGFPVEFLKTREILERWPVRPGALNFAAPGEALISDDTQMTLFTAEGLLRAKARFDERGICHVPSVVAQALLRWFVTQGGEAKPIGEPGWLVKERRLHARRAPGMTCLSALSALAKQGSAPPAVESPPNDSKGCGAVMRVAPCGLVADSRETAFAWGRDTGVVTHGHPSGYLSAAYFAAVIFDLARGAELVDAMREADGLLAKEQGAEEMQAMVRRARELAVEGPPAVEVIERLGGGWVGEEALAIALLCALTHQGSVEDTLWRAAAHSGDSDSTAAITGNLLGAMGLEVSSSWLDVLELRDVIERVAVDLYRGCVEGRRLREYPPH